MSTNENETVTGQDIVYEGNFGIITDGTGVLSLNPQVSTSGLPEVLVLPSEVEGYEVKALDPEMFKDNTRVKEITLPSTITEIPAYFCANATNLRVINGTRKIMEIGERAFFNTRIQEAWFPCLKQMGKTAFARCGYLEVIDIGSVLVIPENAFAHCALLNEIFWKASKIPDGTEESGDGAVSIGAFAFQNTRSLRELPLLAYANQVQDGAFFCSSICSSLPAGGLIASKAFPTFDNARDFWSGIKVPPCRNRIVTKLSQSNAEWATNTFLEDEPVGNERRKYQEGCALFAVMHIHSAITGKYYSHPDRFVEELRANGLSDFIKEPNWPGYFENVAPMFEAMGYRTDVHGMDSELCRNDYQAMVDALAQGAYIYAQVSTDSGWKGNWDECRPDAGHAVVIYGINDSGEVYVLDSKVLHESFREGGLEPGIDIYTYTIPYQNIAGPSSNFVIVYPGSEEPAAKCTGCVASNVFKDDCPPKTTYNGSELCVSNKKVLSDTRPFELSEGVNVSVVSTAYEWEKLPEKNKGYLTAYRLLSSPAYAREEWQPIGSINKYVRYALNTMEWSEWYVVAPTIYVPQENAE